MAEPSAGAGVARLRRQPCPICGRPAGAPWRPFCGKRCADIDLGRWLGEVYRIPSEGPADDEIPGTDER
ncbi:MAG: DNA gyrase inhibitor YacG [Rhodospirillales bacterium]